MASEQRYWEILEKVKQEKSVNTGDTSSGRSSEEGKANAFSEEEYA